MARYFQAPVMGPVDYGYVEPFQERMAVMQQQQALFDKGEAAVRDLYDVGNLDALDPDLKRRDALIQGRYDRVDNMMWDQDGKMRDMRNVAGMVQTEARRRAKEEQSGGEWNAIAANRATALEYKKELDEMQRKGDITTGRRNFLWNLSRARYKAQKGAGQKGPEGAYQTYGTVAAAHNLDQQKISDDYVDNVAYSKLQSAGIFDAEGRLASVETVNKAMQKHFKHVLGGSYIQSGSVEFRTYDLLVKVATESLLQNEKLRDDIMQEAMQQNKDPKQYYIAKINQLADTSANKFASVKFSPKLMKDINYEKELEKRNALAAIDYEKSLENKHFEYDAHNVEGRIKNITDLGKDIAAADENIKALEEKRSLIEKKYFGNDYAEEYKEQLDEIDTKIKEAKFRKSRLQHNQSQIYEQTSEQKGGFKYIANKATDELARLLSNNSSTGWAAWYHENKEAVKDFKMYAADIIKEYQVENNLSDGELMRHISDGTFTASNLDGVNIGQQMEALAKQNGLEPKRAFKWDKTASKARQGMTEGEAVSLSGAFEKDIREIENGDGFTTSRQLTLWEGEGDIKFLNEAATDAFQNNASLINYADGTPVTLESLAEDMPGVLNVSESKLIMSGDIDEETGERLMQAKVVTTKRGKKTVRYFNVIGGENFAQSTNANLSEYAQTLAGSAQTRKSGVTAEDDVQKGSFIKGSAMFAGTDIYKVKALQPGRTHMVTPGGEDVPIVIKKVDHGRYKAGYATWNKDLEKWVEPDFTNNKGLITEVRPWATAGNVSFDSPEAFIELYGYVGIVHDTNPYEATRNRKH